MTFIIHYIVRGPVKDLNFDYATDEPVTRKNLDDLYQTLARDATSKLATLPSQQPKPRVVSCEEIVLANLILIPSGEPATKQMGGS